MNPQLEQDIRESIKRHMSAEMGAILQERLAQADADAKKVTELTSTAESLRRERDAERQKVTALEVQLKQHGELKAREDAVSLRENTAEIKELKIKLEAADGNTKFAQNVALGLVRNVEYRQSVHYTTRNTVPGGVVGGNGMAPYPSVVSETKDETTTTNRYID